MTGKIGAIVTSFGAGQDVAGANLAAANAIDNNNARLLFSAEGIAFLGLIGGSIMNAGAQIYSNYKKSLGDDAASQALFDEFLADPDAAKGVLEGRDRPNNDDDDGEYFPADQNASKAKVLATPVDENAGKGIVFGTPYPDVKLAKDIAILAMSYLELNPLGMIFKNENGIKNDGSTVKKWSKSKDFKGNKVYQRDDIIDINLRDARGKTNLERMKNGNAPIGPDGKPINLHHTLQNHKGPIAEMTQTFHQEHSKVIHINPSSVPSGINRTEFDKWRSNYWIARAKDIMENK